MTNQSHYMTSPMPHVLDIRCPVCGGLARFDFAEIVRIREKKDVPFFQQCEQFDYRMFSDSYDHRWHAAIYYAALHGGTVDAIRELPDGYDRSDWQHSGYLRWSSQCSFGAYACSECHSVHQHELRWPDDAYFHISYRGSRLWAFHRESAVDLRDYIASKLRRPESHRWSRMLLHVPTEFLVSSARATLTKRLDATQSGSRRQTTPVVP